ncbi:2-hydroxyacid dehydrogenase [Roseomonas sp. BN140053]|uniref:2-hydroxyacid dehydrogenase n=1 Tax=Roseomonas sp. BN140053 TaxID=3391898 RepID=UPI0039E86BE2
MTETVVFLDPMTPQRLAQIGELAPEGWQLTTSTGRDEPAQLAAIAEADFAVSGDVPVTAAMLRAAKRLKGVHKWGVGIDNFDTDAARALNIRMMRTTGSNAIPVAETAVSMMLALNRGLFPGHAGLGRGEWLKGTVGPGCLMLTGKTVGLIGLGAIGKSVVRLLSGFQCRVLYHMPRRLAAEEEAALGVEYASFDALLAEADVVSLHCPLSAETRGLIGAAQLRAMKRSAVLINVARGGIVVEEELAAALRAGEIRGAGVDVFATEPVPADNPLLGLPNCIVTPHIGAAAADNFAKTVSRMFRNMQHVARGEEVPTLDVVV